MAQLIIFIDRDSPKQINFQSNLNALNFFYLKTLQRAQIKQANSNTNSDFGLMRWGQNRTNLAHNLT